MSTQQTEQMQAPRTDANPQLTTPVTGENAAQDGSNKGSPKTQSDTPAQANEASNDTTQTQDGALNQAAADKGAPSEAVADKGAPSEAVADKGAPNQAAANK
ncbi:hypothetical protein K474DRAFT_1713930, partial [Panus rudis PR-1116 ss-1]